jgi:hypothetical protein
MKLILRNFTLYLIILSIIISQSLELKSSLKMKSKSQKLSSQFFSELWKAPGSPSPIKKNLEINSQIKADNGAGSATIINEGWMSVSSPVFKNESKFPVFTYPNNGIGEALVTENDYMRINEKYQERPPSLNSSENYTKDPNAPPERTQFYFRLNTKYLYFSETQDCINVLGNFRWIDQTLTARRVSTNCFELQDKSGDKFKYCGAQALIKNILCYIQDKLRFEQDKICKNDDVKDETVTAPGQIVEKIITQPYILIPTAREECNDDWNYRKNGADWECLCKEGTRV